MAQNQVIRRFRIIVLLGMIALGSILTTYFWHSWSAMSVNLNGTLEGNSLELEAAQRIHDFFMTCLLATIGTILLGMGTLRASLTGRAPRKDVSGR